MKILKHAFLILAHNEFSVLERLIHCLDDERNDIYLHIDEKVLTLPQLTTKRAGLFFVEDRVDVRWGDVSVILAEYRLFETAAANGRYCFYHLLSGVDLPLKSQDELHAFFNRFPSQEFIGFMQDDIEKEIDRKVRRFHFYPSHFRQDKGLVNLFFRLVRATLLRMQLLFGIRRNRKLLFKKGPQWVSVTDHFVRYVLQQKKEVLKVYQNTFCSDEIFLQTLCWNSDFRTRIFHIKDELVGSQRNIGWRNGELVDWQEQDYDQLIASDIVFARKFSSKNKVLMDRIQQYITDRSLSKY